jgi:glutamine cyclotransferase
MPFRDVHIFRRFLTLLGYSILIFCLAACGATQQSQFKDLGTYLHYEIIASYPHDPSSYTQGLIWQADHLIESTGLYGESVLRRVDLDGSIIQELRLGPEYFGEGLTELDGKLYQLTWKEHTGFIYASDTFELLGTFRYPTEGWGLTNDGESLILSDGSSSLFYYDPESFELIRTLDVKLEGKPVVNLNELEWVQGSIFANIWLSDLIVRIDPQTGQVLSQINLEGLRPPNTFHDPGLVLNGIAYDEAKDKLYVTGKKWDKVYEIRLIPATAEAPSQPSN